MTLNGCALPIRLLSDSTIEGFDLKCKIFELGSDSRVTCRRPTSVSPCGQKRHRNQNASVVSDERNVAELHGLVSGRIRLPYLFCGIHERQHGLTRNDIGYVESSSVIGRVESTYLHSKVGLSGFDPQVRVELFECAAGCGGMDLPDVDGSCASSAVVGIHIQVSTEDGVEDVDGLWVDLFHLQSRLVGDAFGVACRTYAVAVAVKTDVSVGVDDPRAVGQVYRFVHPVKGSTLLCRKGVML